MIKLDDFMQLNGMFYIGNIIDTDDGDGWVDKEEAEKVLEIVNNGYEE